MYSFNGFFKENINFVKGYKKGNNVFYFNFIQSLIFQHFYFIIFNFPNYSFKLFLTGSPCLKQYTFKDFIFGGYII